MNAEKDSPAMRSRREFMELFARRGYDMRLDEWGYFSSPMTEGAWRGWQAPKGTTQQPGELSLKNNENYDKISNALECANLFVLKHCDKPKAVEVIQAINAGRDALRSTTREPSQPGQLSCGLDTFVLACDEVLRLMALWKRHYGYSDNCEKACNKLREEIQKHLKSTTREPSQPGELSLDVIENAIRHAQPERVIVRQELRQREGQPIEVLHEQIDFKVTPLQQAIAVMEAIKPYLTSTTRESSNSDG